MSFIRATLFRADDEILMPVSLICPEGISVRPGEADQVRPRAISCPSSRRKRSGCISRTGWGLGTGDSQVRLAFVTRGGEFHRRGNEAGEIPAGSSPVGVAQKWVRMPGCQQALRQTLLWCQMGALLPAPAWGLPRAAGTHMALESHPLLVCGLQAASGQGAGPPSHVCFHCRCWQVWKLHMENL